jgi:ClpP class serine protease
VPAHRTKPKRPDPPPSREGQQRAVRAGEHLAIDSRYMQRGPQAFFWLFGPSVKQNERVGNVAIVHVRGPLEHHDDSWGENYEGLLRRFQDALSGEDSRKTIIEKHRIAKMWGDDPPEEDIPESATPPAAVVLCIDSPGGVVSGLNETVFAMQRAKRRAGIPVHVFANELAASAAYALSCVGDDITLPPSAIVGSIGVISMMVDQVGADEKDGFNVVTLTSGARKADGHPHVRIDDDAIAAEQERVDQLAVQFFALVKKARGIDAKPLEASLYLGDKAVKAGLADDVSAWDSFLFDLSAIYGTREKVGVAQNGTPEDSKMSVHLKALVARATKALAEEKDPKKRKTISADLKSFKASLDASTKKTYKKETEEETEESSDEEEEEEGGNDTDRDEEDDSPSKKDDEDDNKEGDEASEESDDDKKEASSEEDDEESAETEPPEKKGKKAKKAEKDSEEEAIAALAKRSGKLSALLAKAEAFDAMGSEVARLSAQDANTKKLALIDRAVRDRRISPAHAKMIRGKSTKFAKDFISMHKASIVFSADEDMTIPDDTGPGASKGQYPKWMQKQFEMQAAAAGLPIEKVIENYTKEQAKASNGAGRY